MKRILIFSLAYAPFMGGAEIAIKEITDRMPRDLEFHIITLRFDRAWPKEERLDNVYAHRIGFGKKDITAARTFSPLFYLSKIFFVPLAAYHAAQLHRRRRFDACWAMMSYMVLPIVLMRLMGVQLPYALTLQEGDTFEHVFKRARLRLLLPLLRYGFKRASVIQTISTYLCAWARAIGFEGPVEVIPNGVDVTKFSASISREARASLRAHVGITERDTLLITTSRLVQKNGIDTVIRALTLLPERVHFLIIGAGPDSVSLQELAQELEVFDRVHFAGSFPQEKLPPYLHSADIFVRPSRSEGMGNSFIEAFAAGIPVIATQAGGIADFLFDQERNPDRGSTGYAVNIDAPEQIARVVKYVTAHPEEVAAVCARAQALAKEKYEWDTIAHDMRERVFAKL